MVKCSFVVKCEEFDNERVGALLQEIEAGNG